MSKNLKKEKIKTITASKFDSEFDQGIVLPHLDVESAKVRVPVSQINFATEESILEDNDQHKSTH